MKKHWSERLVCLCGMSFRSASRESVHRHNFPALYRKPKRKFIKLTPEQKREAWGASKENADAGWEATGNGELLRRFAPNRERETTKRLDQELSG